jgi:hypothetical protein
MAEGREPATSASPPLLAKGAVSDVTNRIFKSMKFSIPIEGIVSDRKLNLFKLNFKGIIVVGSHGNVI